MVLSITFTPSFEKLYSLIKTKCSSPNELALSLLKEEQQTIYDRYKNNLLKKFSSTAEKIVKDYLSQVESSQ